MEVLREFSKVVMFTILWAIPLIVAKTFDNQWWLLLLIVSLIGTIMLFSHYEDIGKMDTALKGLKKLEELQNKKQNPK